MINLGPPNFSIAASLILTRVANATPHYQVHQRDTLFIDEKPHILSARMQTSESKQGLAYHPYKPKKTGFRTPKGPRPFDPESKAASKSLEEHIEQSVHVTEDARRHQLKKLENEKARTKRIGTLNGSFAAHKRNQTKGTTPQDTAKTAFLYDLKKQELEVLQAFNGKTLTEEVTMHTLLEINFLSKMVGGLPIIGLVSRTQMKKPLRSSKRSAWKLFARRIQLELDRNWNLGGPGLVMIQRIQTGTTTCLGATS